MKKPVKPLEELLDSVRDIEGFPIGTDEDILALSNPPYYTACPNPYINDFIEEHGKLYDEGADDYHREPFVADVSEGKNNSIYNAHSYHTKVPHKAIKPYIEHYTNKNDIVLDGFCGTGMTGVAAQLLHRKAILSDLSPIATLITANYNNPIRVNEFEKKVEEIFQSVEKEISWMYETKHTDNINTKNDLSKVGIVNFILWSEVLLCPFCEEEYVFYEQAIDKENKRIKSEYYCPHCAALINKKTSKKVIERVQDQILEEEIIRVKQIPVLVNYTYGKKRFTKKPDQDDLLLLKKIETEPIPYWVPVTKMMGKGKQWGDTWRAGVHTGLTHAHQFYTHQNLRTLSVLWNKISAINDTHLRLSLLLIHSAINNYASKMRRFRPDGKGGGPLPGTMYVASLITPPNVLLSFSRNAKSIANALRDLPFKKGQSIVSVNSATQTSIPDNSIDYIFTDPPFGDNLMYSELNFLWEAWLKVVTRSSSEAIINKSQNKSIVEFQHLITSSFKEYYRVLKPNRWITIVFHNSKSSIWNAIQDSLGKAGFIVSQVSIMDKKQGTFKQVTSAGAVKNDLVISAYKPKTSFDKKFLEQAGEGLEEEFVKMHLTHLKAELSVERTEQMLYSKLLAYYVQRSYTVKYDSSTFYKMLRENFTEEDSYWFNEDQLDDYHEYKQKMSLADINEIKSGQMVLFVQDEKSAIIWLNTFLNEPKSFTDLSPQYQKISNISGDNVPDIKELLDKNFILENGKYRRPQSEEEKLSVTEMRERELQKEFDELLLEAKGSKKKIKECRKQAVIYGFEQCYKNNKFKDILTLASRLNKKIIENDSEITEFIEVAEMKEEGF